MSEGTNLMSTAGNLGEGSESVGSTCTIKHALYW